MILRRIAAAITNQNWFQVTIEIFIVVIGIFLGLQVTDWAEDRNERAEEIEYLARLHEDITDSINQNSTNLKFMERQENYTRIMLDDLSSCHLPPENELIFANGLFTIGKYLPAAFSRTTIDELNSTGKFLVIRNVDLRKALAEHSSYIYLAVEIDRKISSRGMPHVIDIERKFTFNLQTPTKGDDEIKPGDINYDFQTLCKDQAFSQSISVVRAYAFEELARVTEAIEQQQALKAMIEAEMRKFQ